MTALIVIVVERGLEPGVDALAEVVGPGRAVQLLRGGVRAGFLLAVRDCSAPNADPIVRRHVSAQGVATELELLQAEYAAQLACRLAVSDAAARTIDPAGAASRLPPVVGTPGSALAPHDPRSAHHAGRPQPLPHEETRS